MVAVEIGSRRRAIGDLLSSNNSCMSDEVVSMVASDAASSIGEGSARAQSNSPQAQAGEGCDASRAKEIADGILHMRRLMTEAIADDDLPVPSHWIPAGSLDKTNSDGARQSPTSPRSMWREEKSPLPPPPGQSFAKMPLTSPVTSKALVRMPSSVAGDRSVAESIRGDATAASEATERSSQTRGTQQSRSTAISKSSPPPPPPRRVPQRQTQLSAPPVYRPLDQAPTNSPASQESPIGRGRSDSQGREGQPSAGRGRSRSRGREIQAGAGRGRSARRDREIQAGTGRGRSASRGVEAQASSSASCGRSSSRGREVEASHAPNTNSSVRGTSQSRSRISQAFASRGRSESRSRVSQALASRGRSESRSRISQALTSRRRSSSRSRKGQTLACRESRAVKDSLKAGKETEALGQSFTSWEALKASDPSIGNASTSNDRAASTHSGDESKSTPLSLKQEVALETTRVRRATNDAKEKPSHSASSSTSSKAQQTPKFNKHGRCLKHPSIIVAKKKPFGKGWTMVGKDGCQLCLETESRRKDHGHNHGGCTSKGDANLSDGAKGGKSCSKRTKDTAKSTSSNHENNDKAHQPIVSKMRYTTPWGKPGWYSGDTQDGIPHGRGRMRFDDGEQFCGEWTNGYSKQFLDNRRRMEGGFSTGKKKFPWRKDRDGSDSGEEDSGRSGNDRHREKNREEEDQQQQQQTGLPMYYLPTYQPVYYQPVQYGNVMYGQQGYGNY